MPSTKQDLDVNVRVSVAKRFILKEEVKTVLTTKYNWNTPRLSFNGKTIAKSRIDKKIVYDVVLDEAPGITIPLQEDCLKYIGPIDNNVKLTEPNTAPVLTTEVDKLSIPLSQSDGWTAGDIVKDSRLDISYNKLESSLHLSNMKNATPLDYFLFFLPMNHFHITIANINIHARSVRSTWSDLSHNEYLTWIALLTAMTVLCHTDRRVYWQLNDSYFKVNVDFTEYMSYERFNDIMDMHVFEVPNDKKELNDPLYQIRSTIDAFNDHMSTCITPGRYLSIDDPMNQWYGTGMPSLNETPQNVRPLNQEFKTLIDHYSNCVLRIDTMEDPCPKEYDEPNKCANEAAVQRLVKPWFASGRTVIADSDVGSLDAVLMLSNHGLYSIMEVQKLHGVWPHGMPNIDIEKQVKKAYGSYYSMKKKFVDHTLFVCAHRDIDVEALISSCSTTKLTGKKTLIGSNGKKVTFSRPEVAEEYEDHLIDINKNMTDNPISYHNVLGAEKWEICFLGFILGLCEANAFNSFKTYSGKKNETRANFRDEMVFAMLDHCKKLVDSTYEPDPARLLAGQFPHTHIIMFKPKSKKRIRLVCRTCSESGVTGVRVGKACSCNPTFPLCFPCYNNHLNQILRGE